MIDQLHYISQQPAHGTHIDAIECVLEAGGKWIQLRLKGLPKSEVLDFAQRAKILCDRFSAKLIINDHPDIAAEVGAHGVHLGLQDASIQEARSIIRAAMIIGGTANTFEHIVQRAEEGANYIGLGPFRFTRTKKNLSPTLGLAGYGSIMDQVQRAGLSIPVIAIGGIEPADVPLLMQTGIHGVALSGALTNQHHLKEKIDTIYNIYNLC